MPIQVLAVFRGGRARVPYRYCGAVFRGGQG